MNNSTIKSIFAAALCAALASSCGGGSSPKGVRRFLDGMVPVPGTDFLAGKHEVTQREWKSVMGENPVWDDYRKGDDLPVVCVSFLDCETFVRKLNEQAEADGLDVRFRLPSAAEWTVASGGEHFADPAYARFSEGSDGKPDPEKLQPNAFGLFDMFGDVAEWTSDYLGVPERDPALRPSLAMGGHWGVPNLRVPAFVNGTFAEYHPRGDADIMTGFRLFASRVSDAKPFVPAEIASVMEKAKTAAAQGGVAFCGFYPGMSRTDAERLAGYYWFDAAARVADVDYSFLGDPVRLIRLSPAAAEIAMGVDVGPRSEPDVYLNSLTKAVSRNLVLRNAEDIRLLKPSDWLNMCWMGTWDWDVSVTVAVVPVRHLNVEPGVILKCPAESARVLADPSTADRARAELKARKEREAEELFTKREREIGKKRADARKELDAILEIQDDVRNASGWQGAYLVSEYCKALGVRFDGDDPEGTGFRLGNRLKEEEEKFRTMLDEADRELEQLEASMPPALAERLAAERKAREERQAAERRAKEEREAAERKAREEREAAERRAKAEREAREAAERKARAEREAAERKAREEHEAAIRDRMNRWTRGDLEPKERSAVESILSDMVAVPGKRFKLGKREVTRTQWEGVVGTPCPALTDCSKRGEADGPAVPATRNEIREFLAILNSCPAVRNARLEFRLPTDDELRSVRDAKTGGRPARGSSEPAFAGAGFDGFEPDESDGFRPTSGFRLFREMTEKEKRIAEAAECKAKEKKAAEAVRSILESMVEVPGKGFRIGRYEVTQSQWEALMGENPSSSKGADLPVENVSWRDCQRFLKALNAHPLSKRSFTVFRIPESWEWSKAARAGREDPYCLLADGSIITKDCLGEIAWFDENSDAKTHPVGQKGANAYGLYDLYGNVREWTRAPSQDFTWMSTRPIATGRSDVYGVCGGGMNSTSEACKGLEERFSSDDVREPDIGLRLCCDARTILYVDAEKGDDANPGTSRDRPKKTIQAAIDAPSAPAEITRGVTILVADGVYGPIVSHNKDVAIVGENGPEKCIVDGGGTRRCANLTSFGEKFSLPAGGLFGWSELDRVNYAKEANNSRRTRLIGLTLQNGYCDARYELAHGAGILGGQSEGCIVQDCKTKGQGAGIAFGEHDRAIVRRCSQASGSSIGVALTGGWGALPVFRNCLVYECGAGANEPNRGNLVNECIIYNCTIDGSDLGSNYPVVDTGEAYNSILLGSDLHAGRVLKIYNCAYDGKRGSALSYGSEQFRNFKFLDVEKRDYRLAPGSPCIDAGDSAKIESEADLAGNARVRGKAVDMGCYETTPE